MERMILKLLPILKGGTWLRTDEHVCRMKRACGAQSSKFCLSRDYSTWQAVLRDSHGRWQWGKSEFRESIARLKKNASTGNANILKSK